MTQESAIKHARIHTRYQKSDVIFWEDAKVSYPDFNPYRAKNPIAIVTIPVLRNFKDVLILHEIYEGDKEIS